MAVPCGRPPCAVQYICFYLYLTCMYSSKLEAEKTRELGSDGKIAYVDPTKPFLSG